MTSEGKFAAAELMLRQAVELGGHQSEIYVAALASLIGMQEGRTDESVKIIENQLLIRPDNSNLMVAYGLTARAAGLTEEAESTLRHVIEKEPNHPMALHSLATVLSDKGDVAEAEKLACKAFTLVPDHPDFALVAIELLEVQGKMDVAYEVAALGASLNPAEMDLVQKAVEGALARQQPERAWEVLKETDNDLPWVVGWKANLLDHQGKVEEADAMMAQGRQSFGDVVAYLTLEATIWARRGKIDQVKPLVDKVLQIDPTNRTALRLRADYSLGESPEQAVLDLEAIYFEDTNDVSVACDLVSAYYKVRRYQDALEICMHWEILQSEDSEVSIPPQLRVYSTLAVASMGDTKDALWRSDWIPDGLLVDAITELNTYGSGELAEDKLRHRLTDRLPEVIQASPFDTPPAESEAKKPEHVNIEGQVDEITPESLAGDEQSRPKAAPVGTPITRPDLNRSGKPMDSYTHEADEDEDEEYVWVDDDDEDEDEEEEDDDEEYVWVEVDEDDEDEDGEYEWVEVDEDDEDEEE